MNKLLTYLSLCCWKLGWNAIKFWYCLVSFAQYVDIWQEISHKTSHTPSQSFALIKRPHNCQFLYHNHHNSESMNFTVAVIFLLMFIFFILIFENWDLFRSKASKSKSGISNSKFEKSFSLFRLEWINSDI